ncbi:MAG: hypothetical protein JSV04_03790, partial [Candidatus Heimdallarchaeota archaeon]
PLSTSVEIQMQFFNLLKQELNVKDIRYNRSYLTESSDKEYLSIDSQNYNLKLILETQITNDLKQEGIAREIVRAIQNLRKNAELDLDQIILVKYETRDTKLSESLNTFVDYIQKETLAAEIIPEATEGGTFTINGSNINLSIEIVS